MGSIIAKCTAQPIEPREFAHRMSALGAIESPPHIAVACSGGGDSLALTLIANDWAKARGGRVTALIVDHRLRSEYAVEARQVGRWLADHGIDFHILRRPDLPIAGDLQSQARSARYRLMARWCRRAGVMHLLLGHQQEDQAETFLLRLARGSGVDGLAAMAGVTELSDVRLLRPVLDVAHDRLLATLDLYRQPHIEDPSNLNTDFARVRLRRLSPKLADEGMTASRLSGTSLRLGRAREALETAVTLLAARCASPRSEGYCLIQPDPLLEVPEEICLRLLGRALACVAGAEHPPRLHQLERLYDWLRAGGVGGGRTLGGCRVLLWQGKLLVCREASAVTDTPPARRDLVWDRRFRLRAALPKASLAALTVRRLGAHGWRQVLASRPSLARFRLPPAVRPTLPAFWSLDDVVAVPHFNYVHEGAVAGLRTVPNVSFVPTRAFGGPRFAFASSTFHAIL